ncbi:MAG: hypothetical protein COA74_06140 [Gammaproteobacteria bacterium]|nr:MAG: hypothetical protein COA74_06140 [Gammaproteobacteria bacterium]
MNNKGINTGLALLVASSLSLPLVADQEYLEVDSFKGIDLGTGMNAEVVCGSKNTVTLTARKMILDRLEVSIKGGHLEISRHTSASHILNKIFGDEQEQDNSVTVNIETTSALSIIEGSTGSMIKVDSCAINSSALKVDAGTGASIQIEGSTGALELNLSTGSVFNNSSSQFTVDSVEVDMSTGSKANLCGANTIRGSASTGAVIKAGEGSMTEDVSLSLGAEVHKNKCR